MVISISLRDNHNIPEANTGNNGALQCPSSNDAVDVDDFMFLSFIYRTNVISQDVLSKTRPHHKIVSLGYRLTKLCMAYFINDNEETQ